MPALVVYSPDVEFQDTRSKPPCEDGSWSTISVRNINLLFDGHCHSPCTITTAGRPREGYLSPSGPSGTCSAAPPTDAKGHTKPLPRAHCQFVAWKKDVMPPPRSLWDAHRPNRSMAKAK
ncbi:hypothetical protein Salat_1473200 [Sesamum alatum]|uniref:Uncharacterized protein n=1 Tax=Sesamum alatum TaxID=300844 RepID=A0AAE1YBE8_9LAMI|nr:hypothetical protein Salat_1473200 [Sesamum alatum]